eukprot:923344-Pleurochrysis_carterae.AAC.2
MAVAASFDNVAAAHMVASGCKPSAAPHPAIGEAGAAAARAHDRDRDQSGPASVSSNTVIVLDAVTRDNCNFLLGNFATSVTPTRLVMGATMAPTLTALPLALLLCGAARAAALVVQGGSYTAILMPGRRIPLLQTSGESLGGRRESYSEHVRMLGGTESPAAKPVGKVSAKRKDASFVILHAFCRKGRFHFPRPHVR